MTISNATRESLDDVVSQYALFYCVSAYPTIAADFDLKTLGMLEEIADVPVEFSDHSPRAEAAKVTIGNNAAVIEKHFMIDPRLLGPGQQVYIEPDKLTDFREIATLYDETSTGKEELDNKEVEIKQWAQHSIVATEPIDQG